MQTYEYKVVPAPARSDKLRGVKTTEDRYAQTLTALMNAQARDGWDYLRSDTLPTEERVGLTKRRTVYVTLLVFRREVSAEAAAPRLALTAAAPLVATPRLDFTAEGAAPKLGPATEPAP